MKGNITTEFTAWCAECEHWDQECWSHTKGKAIKAFRERGWRMVKGKWICPKHNSKPRKSDELNLVTLSEIRKKFE